MIPHTAREESIPPPVEQPACQVDRSWRPWREQPLLRTAALAGLGLSSLLLTAAAGGAAAPPASPLYVFLAGGLLLGLLLTVRFMPGRQPTSLVVLPLVVFWVHFGPSALLPLAWAALAAGLIRGVGAGGALAASGTYLAAGAGAWIVGGWVHEVTLAPWAGPAAAAALFQPTAWLLTLLRARIAPLSPTEELPDPLLPTLLAPLAVLPLAAGARLGDGAALLSLSALLAALFVVREAVNLATARAEAEHERDRLAEAYRLQEELVNLITHDLRNPLTVVLASTAMLRRLLPPDEHAASYVERAERGARSMQRLVDALLQAGRLESATELPQPVAVDLLVVAEQVVAELNDQAEQKHIRLSVWAEPGPRAMALAQPGLVRQAIMNLAANALKYTPVGGSVTLRVVRSAGTGARPRVEVADTGEGILPEEQEHVFQKFYRGARARLGGEPGVGLGLALTRTVVERMNGRIWFESTPNRGSIFYLELPPA